MKRLILICLIAFVGLSTKAQKSLVVKSATNKVAFDLNAYPKIIFGESEIIFTDNTDSIGFSKNEPIVMYYTQQPAKGDVDGDGKLTQKDAKIVVDAYLKKGSVKVDIESADVNGDGKVTMADANAIVNICLGRK